MKLAKNCTKKRTNKIFVYLTTSKRGKKSFFVNNNISMQLRDSKSALRRKYNIEKFNFVFVIIDDYVATLSVSSFFVPYAFYCVASFTKTRKYIKSTKKKYFLQLRETCVLSKYRSAKRALLRKQRARATWNYDFKNLILFTIYIFSFMSDKKLEK